MSREDPFELENDPKQTVFHRAYTAVLRRSEDSPRAAPRESVRPEDMSGAGGGNRLISAFFGVLGLAPELERARPPQNPETMRERMVASLTEARERLVTGGIPPDRADQARWFVAATVDDVVLNTPWGAASSWPQRSLVTTFSGEVTAGQRFYDRAEEHLRFADRDPEMLELVFACLSLGFRGKHRLGGGAGEAEIALLRDRIARVLRRRSRPLLSPQWEGVQAPDESRRFTVPLLSLPVMAGALVVLLYLAIDWRLETKAEQTFEAARGLPPLAQARIDRSEMLPLQVSEEANPVPVEPVDLFSFLPIMEAGLDAGQFAALARSEETPTVARLRLLGTSSEVFASARATLDPDYERTIAVIAAAIRDNAEAIRHVTVEGHTDSVRVSASNPFGSNQGLSEARAETVVQMLVVGGVPADLLEARGLAESQPLETNETNDGRAANRRVEIVIEKGL